jgi:hypothetical protein
MRSDIHSRSSSQNETIDIDGALFEKATGREIGRHLIRQFELNDDFHSRGLTCNFRATGANRASAHNHLRI